MNRDYKWRWAHVDQSEGADRYVALLNRLRPGDDPEHFPNTLVWFCTQLLSEDVTAAGAPDWLRRWSDLYKAVLEARAGLKAAAIRYPEDESARRAFETCQEEVIPRWLVAKQRLTEKLLAIDGFQPGPEHGEMLRRLYNQDGLFREESVPLDQQLSEAEGDWWRIFGSMTVQVDGQDLSLPAANARLQDLDRSSRESAWRGINEAWLQKREEIGELFLRTVRTRHQLARVAGLPNYLAYRWREMDRLDYSPADATRFHTGIEREIVPLGSRLLDVRRSKMKVESIRPWDLTVDRELRPPLAPFKTVDQLEEGVARILSRVDQKIGELFDRMRDGWMDLAARQGKPGGGEEWCFPQSGMPYIVANAVGTHTNIMTVLHEMGHAAHDFISRRHQDLIWNGGGPTEFEELAASAMVFLADPYLELRYGGFYTLDQAEQGRTGNIEYYAHSVRRVAIMDAFEQWVYRSNPDTLTVEALDRTWLDLSQRFDPDVDWSGLEQQRMSGWLQLSLFHFGNPCYFITYGLSQLGAFDVWRRARKDQAAAMAAYKDALALGNTRPLSHLYQSAGARLPFDRSTVRDTAEFIAELIV